MDIHGDAISVRFGATQPNAMHHSLSPRVSRLRVRLSANPQRMPQTPRLQAIERALKFLDRAAKRYRGFFDPIEGGSHARSLPARART